MNYFSAGLAWPAAGRAGPAAGRRSSWRSGDNPPPSSVFKISGRPPPHFAQRGGVICNSSDAFRLPAVGTQRQMFHTRTAIISNFDLEQPDEQDFFDKFFSPSRTDTITALRLQAAKYDKKWPRLAPPPPGTGNARLGRSNA